MALDTWNIAIFCLMAVIFTLHCFIMYAMGLKWWAAIVACLLIWGMIGLFWVGLACLFTLP